MAKTFNDFMIECAVYPYSQAHFELMKECSELELTAQFLESQRFLSENHDAIFGESVTLDPGYLTESADEQTISVMTEKFEERVVGVWSKVVTGVKNLLKTLRNLFLRISAKFDENSRAADALLKKFNSKGGIDQQGAEHMVKVLHGASREGFEIPKDRQQPFASKIKFSGFPDDTKQQLAVALSTTSVILKTPNANNNTAALDIRDIRGIMKAFKGTSSNEAALKGCQTQLKSAISDSLKGLTIPCGKDYLKNCAEDLKKLQEELDGEGGIGAQAKGAAKGRMDNLNAERKAAKAEGNEGPRGDGGMKVASLIYSSLTTCIGATTKMYLGLYNYRNAVVKGLSSLVPDVGYKGKEHVSEDDLGKKNDSKQSKEDGDEGKSGSKEEGGEE